MSEEEFDIEDLRFYKSLSAKEKLEYLEEMLNFLQKITPSKAVIINEQLKKEGF
jgi:hypothetical protein